MKVSAPFGVPSRHPGRPHQPETEGGGDRDEVGPNQHRDGCAQSGEESGGHALTQNEIGGQCPEGGCRNVTIGFSMMRTIGPVAKSSANETNGVRRQTAADTKGRDCQSAADNGRPRRSRSVRQDAWRRP